MPSALPGLAAHYRADLGVTLSGATVSAWADQSINGRHLSNGSASQQPTYVSSIAALGSRPGLSFDGGDILSTAAFSMPRAVTAFFVLGSITTRGMLMEHGAANDGFYAYAVGAASVAIFGSAGIGYHRVRESPPSLWAAANSQNALVYDESAAPVMRAARAVVTPTLTEGVAQASQTLSKTLYVGARSGPTLAHSGQIAEIILYERALNAGEIAAVESYLFDRYGV